MWILWKISFFLCKSIQTINHLWHTKWTISGLHLFEFRWLWLTDHEKKKISISKKLNISWRQSKNIFSTQKCQPSERFVYVYALSTWLGPRLHWLLYRCGVAWGLSAFGAAGVLWRPRLLLVVIFGSSVLLGLLSLTFLWTMPHGFFMGFGSGGFAGQSGAVEPWFLGQALVLFALWAGAKSCWKMETASPVSIPA